MDILSKLALLTVLNGLKGNRNFLMANLAKLLKMDALKFVFFVIENY